MNKTKYFIEIFKKAEKKYGKSEKRLAAEGWGKDWEVLIATIMSAQTRDETTIKVADGLFKKYGTLEKLARASVLDIERMIKGINYYKTKARNISQTAKLLIKEYNGKVPDKIEELVKLPGVGRKTANLIVTEVHKGDGICVDTHVHRISNVLGIVKTKSRDKTEMELRKIAPKRYWARINRLFVLWGKDVRGRDRKKILSKLEEGKV